MVKRIRNALIAGFFLALVTALYILEKINTR